MFWLRVSEVSVCGQLALVIWACGKAVHYGREYIMEQSYSLHKELQAKREKEPTVPIYPSRTCPQQLNFFYDIPPSKDFITSQQCHWLGTKHLTHEHLEDIPDPNYTGTYDIK